jgi:hypothetical protein
MLLRKDKFTECKISIAGYQFPHLGNDIDDGNWLNVLIEAKHPKGNWEKVDACLETFELKSLISWLEKIAKRQEVEKHLYFIEPCLEFEFIKDTVIRVYFDYEVAPTWRNKNEKVFMDFEMTEKDFERVIKELNADLENFPIKKCRT